MMAGDIRTPNNCSVHIGNTHGQLTWGADFGSRRNGAFSQAQMYVDSEVLRRCSPRVPFQTGMLERSGKLGTTIGSGSVRYIVPYAAYQYYNTAESRGYDPNRGGKWFERMKAAEGRQILDGAGRMM